jgi:hypothetical protein
MTVATAVISSVPTIAGPSPPTPGGATTGGMLLVRKDQLMAEAPLPITVIKTKASGMNDVIQPDLGGVGGLTEAVRCAEMALHRGLVCVPHAWKTGLTVAATRHFLAATPNCPYTELIHPDFFPSFLRHKLAMPEPELHNGEWSLPERPGLGIELDEEIVKQSLTCPVAVVK